MIALCWDTIESCCQLLVSVDGLLLRKQTSKTTKLVTCFEAQVVLLAGARQLPVARPSELDKQSNSKKRTPRLRNVYKSANQVSSSRGHQNMGSMSARMHLEKMLSGLENEELLNADDQKEELIRAKDVAKRQATIEEQEVKSARWR